MKFNKYFLTGFVSFVVATGVMYTFLSMAAGPAFGLYLSPSSANVAKGSDINVSVYANLGQTSVQAMAAYIIYDPAKLRLKAANQAGVDPNYTVVARSSALDGSKPEGEVVFVAGYSGTGAITPADGLLLGNLTFTALTDGNTNVTFNPDVILSGFSSPTTPRSVLDTRGLSNATYTISGGTAPAPSPSPTPSPTPSPSAKPPSAGGNTSPSSPSTTTKKSTPSTSSTGSSSTPSSQTSNENTEQTATNSEENNEVEITPVGDGGSGGTQLFSPTILAASAGLAALLVGLGFLAFSPPVRHAFADIRTLFNQPSAQLVGGGTTSNVQATSNNVQPGSVPTPTPPTVPDNPDAISHSPGDIIYPSGNKPPEEK